MILKCASYAFRDIRVWAKSRLWIDFRWKEYMHDEYALPTGLPGQGKIKFGDNKAVYIRTWINSR
jgi:hypothetical protein